MSSIPKAIARAANTRITLPKLSTPGYESYLRAVSQQGRGAKQALSVLGKENFDQEYSQKLQEQFGNDEKLVRKQLDIAKSKNSRDLWEKFVSSGDASFGASPTFLVPGVEQLKLPSIGSGVKSGKGHKNDQWERQTYEEFAEKCKRKNPDVRFDKQLMDDALRRAVHIITPRGKNSFVNIADVETMLARCLRKESERYWKDRE